MTIAKRLMFYKPITAARTVPEFVAARNLQTSKPRATAHHRVPFLRWALKNRPMTDINNVYRISVTQEGQEAAVNDQKNSRVENCR
jgi:hypothetical protein